MQLVFQESYPPGLAFRQSGLALRNGVFSFCLLKPTGGAPTWVRHAGSRETQIRMLVTQL
jgi:hypothetical protein